MVCAACSLPLAAAAQEPQPADTSARQLGEVIVTFHKWEHNQNEVPNKITKIRQEQIFRNNPQTSADLLSQTGTVFVQKSQLGGGSPMIRGFATNRVLLVVDGVRMNNAIYRSGNLQNVISVDALSLETSEVIFGPGSLIYGSDAIGGVMDFHSLQPRISHTEKPVVKGSGLVRYSSANQENTLHGDINIGGGRWSFLSSFTYSSFGDQQMGKYGGQDSYLRPEYVQRTGGRDSILRNSDPRVQRFTGYNQLNLLHKLRYRAGKHLDLVYGYTYARTDTTPRYDRLIQYRNGNLRFAEWNYGPMIWNMHNLQLVHKKKNQWYDEARLVAAYQQYEESRIDRARNSNNRNILTEAVTALSLNADANKKLTAGTLYYGAEWVWNNVRSRGEREVITNGLRSAIPSRYPDGSNWQTAGLYASYRVRLADSLLFSSGVRYSLNRLAARFDTALFAFPFRDTRLREGAVTGNAGLVFQANRLLQLNLNLSTGFRMPNVDDIGKLFESTPGLITVPNPGLRSEYAWNFEAGWVLQQAGKYRLEGNLFFTLLDNAIVRRPFTFNGSDSILFQGIVSQVEALQNVARATVYGIQISGEWQLLRQWQLVSHANWIGGRETDEVRNEQVPLRHAPPFYGSTFLRFHHNRWWAELGTVYNSAVTFNRLAPTERAKPEIYARDNNGNPFAPGWHQVQVRTTYEWKQLLLSLAWENITNRRYRPYSSGIVAAGSNLIVGMRIRI